MMQHIAEGPPPVRPRGFLVLHALVKEDRDGDLLAFAGVVARTVVVDVLSVATMRRGELTQYGSYVNVQLHSGEVFECVGRLFEMCADLDLAMVERKGVAHDHG